MSSGFDHIYTPRSCWLPGTVFSSTNATTSVTTMFKDISAFIAKSSWQTFKPKMSSNLGTNKSQSYSLICLDKLTVCLILYASLSKSSPNNSVKSYLVIWQLRVPPSSKPWLVALNILMAGR